MTKVLCILGSPRKGGNTETMAKRFLDAAQAKGAQVETFRLYDLAYRGCVACLGCKKHAEACVLRDDLTPVLTGIAAADVVVLAAPVYFGQVPGPVKCLIDRMYSFFAWSQEPGRLYVSRLAPGKHFVFVTSQGSPDPATFNMYLDYAPFLGGGWFGFETHLLRAVGKSKPGEVAQDAALMARAEALAREIVP